MIGKQKTLIGFLGLGLFLSGCDSGHLNRKDIQARFNQGNGDLNAMEKRRLGAVLAVGNPSTQYSQTYPGQQAGGTGGVYPGQQGGAGFGQNSTVTPFQAGANHNGRVQGEIGNVRIISIIDRTESGGLSSGFGDHYRSGSPRGSLVQARITGISLTIDGLNSGSRNPILTSQIGFSPVPSMITATAPEGNKVWNISVNPSNGGVIATDQLILGEKPTAIDWTYNDEFGILGVVAQAGGTVGILGARLLNSGGLGAYVNAARQKVYAPNMGRALDVKFTPDGKYLLVAYDPAFPNSNRSAAFIMVCDVGRMLGRREYSVESLSRRGWYGPGCGSIVDEDFTGSQAGLMTGTQSIFGIPIKLALGRKFVGFLDPKIGPDLVGVEDIRPVFDFPMEGYPQNPALAQTFPMDNTRNDYTDFAYLPTMERLVALNRNRVEFVNLDNSIVAGEVDSWYESSKTGSKYVSVAVDPGYDPALEGRDGKFILVADQGNQSVLVGTLHNFGRAAGADFNGDEFIVPQKPIDVAIARGRPPMAQAPAPQPPVVDQNAEKESE